MLAAGTRVDATEHSTCAPPSTTHSIGKCGQCCRQASRFTSCAAVKVRHARRAEGEDEEHVQAASWSCLNGVCWARCLGARAWAIPDVHGPRSS